jgi:hypothetical protein
VVHIHFVEISKAAHEPLPFGMTLDAYGRFRDIEGHLIFGDDLSAILNSSLCRYKGKCVVDVGLSDGALTKLSVILKSLIRLRNSADPGAETHIYIYTSLEKPGNSRAAGLTAPIREGMTLQQVHRALGKPTYADGEGKSLSEFYLRYNLLVDFRCETVVNVTILSNE